MPTTKSEGIWCFNACPTGIWDLVLQCMPTTSQKGSGASMHDPTGIWDLMLQCMPDWNFLLLWIIGGSVPVLKRLLHCSAPLFSACCCLTGLPFPCCYNDCHCFPVVPSIGFLLYNDFWFYATIPPTLLHLGIFVGF